MDTKLCEDDSEAILASIVEYSHEAIISQTLDGTITSWNPAAKHLYGYTTEEIIGKSISIIVPDYLLNEADELLIKLKKGEIVSNFETERRHKDGHLISVSISISPIKNSKSQLVGVSTVDRDITERKKIKQLKAKFISIVSHELRTPLTSIMGSLDLVLDGTAGEINSQVRELVEIAAKNGERLIHLINDIVDIEKIESGQMIYKYEELNINSVVEEAIVSVSKSAKKEGIDINLIKKSPGVFVKVDHERLLQVLINLLSNALKFTPRGKHINVTIDVIDSMVRVSIIDYGSGVDKEFQDQLFQNFSQAGNAIQRTKGTGLGLSISKSIITQFKGQIGFQPNETTGSIFYFDLPINRTERP